MYIYDSVKKEKLLFEPMEENRVRIYLCGPTVYDDAHLGHARSSISFDLLVRVLRENGYEVIFVKNFTDIDDKIIKKAVSENCDISEITSKYIDRYLEDMEALNVLRADIEPKATECIAEMEQFITNLLNKQIAYKALNGDIYFDTSKDKYYNSLSKRDENSLNEHRVELNEDKINQKDFALWKACKDEHDVCFDSIVGRGRPGWHIECSCMIDKYLDNPNLPFSIDIHAGGKDLLFPHHENEAAQSRCAKDKELSKYWMHNGFVRIDGEKMSKSLGNSFFIKDALKNYHGEVLRFYLMSVHYRSDFNFSEEDLIASKKRVDKIFRLKKRVFDVAPSNVDKNFKQSMIEALNDDLNISKALAVIDEMVSNSNEFLDKNPKDKAYKQTVFANLIFIESVLGVAKENPYNYFQFGIDNELKNKIEELINIRVEAKKSKDYVKADKIRDELNSLNISIMDTPNGTVWEVN
ncbi:MAG: cysteine--tRNA ligase [Campylobacterales bacterium]|nr:cysteine--tRNA ligase [Campylobacterales bacterium]